MNARLKTMVRNTAHTKIRHGVFWVLALLLVATACQREQRQFQTAPPAARINAVAESELYPGAAPASVPTRNEFELRAYDVSQGKQLYEWFNCVGCHAHGGGDIGPPLMDEKWVYGSDPAQIFSSIVEGRPNGMPAYRGKVPDPQVWQIVAYIRSMTGQVPKDVAPGRDDNMSTKEPESMTEQKRLKNSGASKSSEQ